jgi:transposase
MSQNFVGCDRGQVLLMPPSLADWVPDDHLVWTVLGAVERMDLDSFYGAYRANGQGRAAYDPEMMVGLLLYSYARGNRSSRGIERACREDVTYKLITAMRVPDHSTVAEFRRRHDAAISELFVEVLALCQEAGLVSVGVISIDGTKIRASASRDQNRSYAGIVAEILDEAEQTDREEDEQHGDARGDELPERFRSRESRRDALAEAKQRLDEKKAAAERDAPMEAGVEQAVELDVERLGGHAEGRRGWLRNGRRQLDEQRERDARPVARSRSERLADAKRRLEEQLAVEIQANAAYEAWRARGLASDGRPFGVRPDPYTPPAYPEGSVNITDPDSRVMRTVGQPTIQGYNAQPAVTENQIIVAAEITSVSSDFGHLEPVFEAALRDLERAGVSERPGVLVADAGYWHKRQMEKIVANGSQVLIPPDSDLKEKPRAGWTGGLYDHLRRVLKTELGHAIYQQRKQTVEPVFGHTKHNRRIDRFQRRGRAAALSEWRLIAATHNLAKLHTHQKAAATA